MHISDLKSSNFLRKEDCDPPILVTIRDCTQENVAKEGATPEMKWALHFDEVDKPCVLNSTNGQIIAKITGAEDSEGWAGHKVVLYNDPNVSFGGKLTGGIRVRAPKGKATGTPVKPKPAPAPVEEEDDGSEIPF